MSVRTQYNSGMQLQWERVHHGIFAWLPAVAWYSMIYWLSDQPSLPGPEALWAQFVLFKTAHVVVYAVLTGFVLLAVQATWIQGKFLQHARLAWLFVLTLALLDELHQWFVPGRGPHLRDVGIDMMAASILLWGVSRYNAGTLGWFGSKPTKKRK